MGKYIHRDGRGPRSPTFPHINIAALASSIGISRGQVSKILSGKSNASVNTLVAMAQSLGLTTDELLAKIQAGKGTLTGAGSATKTLAVEVSVKEKEQ